MHLLTVSVGQRCWWSPTDFATLALKRRWPPRQPPPPEHREVLIIHSIYTHPENWSMDINNSHNLKGDNVEPKNHPFGKKSMLVFGGVSPSLDNPGFSGEEIPRRGDLNIPYYKSVYIHIFSIYIAQPTRGTCTHWKGSSHVATATGDVDRFFWTCFFWSLCKHSICKS